VLHKITINTKTRLGSNTRKILSEYLMDQERVKKLVRELIIEIGEDPTREGLKDTPERIGRMYQEIFNGYESDSELSVQFSEDSDTVVARDIQFYSMCEHHMLLMEEFLEYQN
jgi:GTP cyclohydrolase I